MCTNTCMFCVVYSSIQKFTIITIMKTAIFITIIFVISILSNYLNYRTALICTRLDCFKMEKLTVSKVTDLLCAECNPDSLLTVLAGMLYCMHKFVCMCDNYMLSQRITLTELHWLRYLKISKIQAH